MYKIKNGDGNIATDRNGILEVVELLCRKIYERANERQELPLKIRNQG